MGCIIKCPKCGKGHMRELKNMAFGKNMRESSAIIDEKYPKRAYEYRVGGVICNRCGYVSR